MPNRRTAHPIILVPMLVFLALFPTFAAAQTGSVSGGFTRMGFGARGIGMGNAMAAVTEGLLNAYYNPALTPFVQGHVFQGSYSFLTLDRKLNQVAYTQNLPIEHKGAGNFAADPDLQSVLGFSAGWINAGDANIDGRDDDGFATKTLGVFENQFSFTVANRFNDRLAVGLSFKFYYSGFNIWYVNSASSLTSSGFGVDAGLLYRAGDRLNIALVAKELVTKYRWDTGNLYGPETGKSTESPFARLYRLGAAYRIPDAGLILSGEAEYSNQKTFLLRAGAEHALNDWLILRAGCDRIELTSTGMLPMPAVGFSVTQPLGTFSPAVHYAVQYDPVTFSTNHVLSISLLF